MSSSIETEESCTVERGILVRFLASYTENPSIEEVRDFYLSLDLFNKIVSLPPESPKREGMFKTWKENLTAITDLEVLYFLIGMAQLYGAPPIGTDEGTVKAWNPTVPEDDSDRKYQSLLTQIIPESHARLLIERIVPPKGMIVMPSCIPHAGLGVFTLLYNIHRAHDHTFLGEYVGRVSDKKIVGDYVLAFTSREGIDMWIDAAITDTMSTDIGSWVRYVNDGGPEGSTCYFHDFREKDEETQVIMSQKIMIAMKSGINDIPAGVELLVFYNSLEGEIPYEHHPPSQTEARSPPPRLSPSPERKKSRDT